MVALSGDAYNKHLERKAEADFLAGLAKARARPRRWTCETSDSLTKRYAKEWAYLATVGQDPDDRAERDAWGLPADSAAFVADFRALTDPTECVRVARAVDANTRGLVEHHLVVYRVGRVLLLPTFSFLADTTGKVIAVFVH